MQRRKSLVIKIEKKKNRMKFGKIGYNFKYLKNRQGFFKQLMENLQYDTQSLMTETGNFVFHRFVNYPESIL